MFSSQNHLLKRSGKKGVDRPDYLKELVDEYKASEKRDVKEQILANLANFCYDPLNFKWLIDLGIINIFLQEIIQNSGLIQQFSITGICNLAAEYNARALIIKNGGVSIVSSLLNSANEKCIIDAITTIIFLTSDKSKTEVVDENALNQIRKHSGNENPRIRNLALLFMTDINNSSKSND